MSNGRIKIGTSWQEVTDVNDGNEYTIQNVSEEIEFIVYLDVPPENVKGGVLSRFKQLIFKKVTGKLYMRSPVTYGSQYIYVEEVEK